MKPTRPATAGSRPRHRLRAYKVNRTDNAALLHRDLNIAAESARSAAGAAARLHGGCIDDWFAVPAKTLLQEA